MEKDIQSRNKNRIADIFKLFTVTIYLLRCYTKYNTNLFVSQVELYYIKPVSQNIWIWKEDKSFIDIVKQIENEKQKKIKFFFLLSSL